MRIDVTNHSSLLEKIHCFPLIFLYYYTVFIHVRQIVKRIWLILCPSQQEVLQRTGVILRDMSANKILRAQVSLCVGITFLCRLSPKCQPSFNILLNKLPSEICTANLAQGICVACLGQRSIYVKIGRQIRDGGEIFTILILAPEHPKAIYRISKITTIRYRFTGANPTTRLGSIVAHKVPSTKPLPSCRI